MKLTENYRNHIELLIHSLLIRVALIIIITIQMNWEPFEGPRPGQSEISRAYIIYII